MIPWLLVAELLSVKEMTLSELVADRIACYPASGEINRRLADPEKAIAKVLETYQEEALSMDHTDGISLEFEHWRFNLRSSNTEPLVRLNVESRGDSDLMKQQTASILSILDGQ